jgi:hypothetical protein
MTHRASPSGISLTERDAAIAKSMLRRGDRQHDVAAWFGVNAGRIAEIATKQSFWWVEPASPEALPPSGPYLYGASANAVAKALGEAKRALDEAEKLIRSLGHTA